MFSTEPLYPWIAPNLPLCPHRWMECMTVPMCLWMGWVSLCVFINKKNIHYTQSESSWHGNPNHGILLTTVTLSDCQWNSGEEQSYNYKHYWESWRPVGCTSWEHGPHQLWEGNQWLQGCTFSKAFITSRGVIFCMTFCMLVLPIARWTKGILHLQLNFHVNLLTAAACVKMTDTVATVAQEVAPFVTFSHLAAAFIQSDLQGCIYMFTFTLMAHCTSGAIRGSVSCSRTLRQGIELATFWLLNDFFTSWPLSCFCMCPMNSD